MARIYWRWVGDWELEWDHDWYPFKDKPDEVVLDYLDRRGGMEKKKRAFGVGGRGIGNHNDPDSGLAGNPEPGLRLLCRVLCLRPLGDDHEPT